MGELGAMKPPPLLQEGMLNGYTAKGGAITGFLQTAWQTKLPKTNVILNPSGGTVDFEDP